MDENMIIQTLKITFAATGAVIVQMLGGGDDLLTLLGALIGFDFLLGILKAIKTKTFASSIVRWGAVNKALSVVLIMIFYLFDQTMGLTIFRNGAVIWFCICEAASMVENLVVLGVPCPDGLQEMLVQLKTGVSINFVDVFKKLLDEKLNLKKGEDDHADK